MLGTIGALAIYMRSNDFDQFKDNILSPLMSQIGNNPAYKVMRADSIQPGSTRPKRSIDDFL